MKNTWTKQTIEIRTRSKLSKKPDKKHKYENIQRRIEKKTESVLCIVSTYGFFDQVDERNVYYTVAYIRGYFID